MRPDVQAIGASGLAHQQDGKVVIVGSSYNGTDNDIHVIRFLADGTPDSAWGDRGQLISSIGTNESAYGVMAQPDGKIIIVGTADNGINSDFSDSEI